MSKTFARGGQHSLRGSFRIALIGLLRLVRAERTALAIREFCFLQFGHATMPASVQGEVRRQAQLGAHSLNGVLHRHERIWRGGRL